ncbi:MAG TPA: hypothetical protein VNR51_12195 [Hyphomicrobium sp.]|nr:hypothetical protein [Hyphomicrobium sp.]
MIVQFARKRLSLLGTGTRRRRVMKRELSAASLSYCDTTVGKNGAV